MGEINHNQELSEEDKQELLREVRRERDHKNCYISEFLVRGALLQCQCGSHPRRLNLPNSYGYYSDEKKMHPFVSEKDCIYGVEDVDQDKNIYYFGVCNSPKTPEGSHNICLKSYDNPKENVNGMKCEPVIMGQWLDPLDDHYVTVPGTQEQYLMLCHSSFLVCKYGGIIKVRDRDEGQDYWDDEMEALYNQRKVQNE